MVRHRCLRTRSTCICTYLGASADGDSSDIAGSSSAERLAGRILGLGFDAVVASEAVRASGVAAAADDGRRAVHGSKGEGEVVQCWRVDGRRDVMAWSGCRGWSSPGRRGVVAAWACHMVQRGRDAGQPS